MGPSEQLGRVDAGIMQQDKGDGGDGDNHGGEEDRAPQDYR